MKLTEKYPFSHAVLRDTFGAEYLDLDDDARDRVLRDYAQIPLGHEISGAEYQRRIGRGNLAAYSRCLK